jgi:hypothetical protein
MTLNFNKHLKSNKFIWRVLFRNAGFAVHISRGRIDQRAADFVRRYVDGHAHFVDYFAPPAKNEIAGFYAHSGPTTGTIRTDRSGRICA